MKTLSYNSQDIAGLTVEQIMNYLYTSFNKIPTIFKENIRNCFKVLILTDGQLKNNMKRDGQKARNKTKQE